MHAYNKLAKFEDLMSHGRALGAMSSPTGRLGTSIIEVKQTLK